MYAKYFEFNGITSKLYNIAIVSFDGARDGALEYGGEITYNTSKAVNNNRWNMHGAHYENPLTFEFSIGKLDCDTGVVMSEFTPSEQARIKRWLEKFGQYKYLRFLCDDYADIYYRCTIALKWHAHGDKIIGADLTVTCDAPYGYSASIVYRNDSFKAGETLYIKDGSDRIGTMCFDQVGLIANTKGDIGIKNTTEIPYNDTSFVDIIDRETIVKNCVAGEVITIDGFTKQIATDQEDTHTTIADDYNYICPFLINYNIYENELRQNTFENTGTADLTVIFVYREIRQVVM